MEVGDVRGYLALMLLFIMLRNVFAKPTAREARIGTPTCQIKNI